MFNDLLKQTKNLFDNYGGCVYWHTLFLLSFNKVMNIKNKSVAYQQPKSSASFHRFTAVKR